MLNVCLPCFLSLSHARADICGNDFLCNPEGSDSWQGDSDVDVIGVLHPALFAMLERRWCARAAARTWNSALGYSSNQPHWARKDFSAALKKTK